jgi:hypothetical protein
VTPLERLAAAPEPVRAAALELLDEVSRPLTARDLEHAFAREGFTRSQRRPLIRALKYLNVIALVRDRKG